MPSFPFFRFPYQNQYYPYYTNYNRPIIQNTNNSNPNINSISSEDFEKSKKKIQNRKKDHLNIILSVQFILQIHLLKRI